MIDGLPEQVEIAGQQVPISSDFRTGILFEELLQDPGLDDLEKLQTALHLYFPGVVFDYDVLDEALSRLVWFYRCGTDPAETTGEKSGAAEEDPPFSYEHDADYIYSAFMQAYGLDLARHPLHWWQFRALFRSLPEDTQLVKIIGYRTAKVSKEQRQHYEHMKRVYALPQSADRQQLESDLNKLLMNGGNPAALLNGSEVRSWHQMEP